MLENSIRLRLTQSEVTHFHTDGKVEQVIKFGISDATQLRYAIQIEDVTNITATYQDNKISIAVPAQMAKEWASSDRISLEETVSINQKETLRILIEKDFKCMHVRINEDESDSFPHPKT